jgi:hypothetical protein
MTLTIPARVRRRHDPAPPLTREATLLLVLIAILSACIYSGGCAVAAGAAAGGAAGYIAGHSAAEHENEKERENK